MTFLPNHLLYCLRIYLYIDIFYRIIRLISNNRYYTWKYSDICVKCNKIGSIGFNSIWKDWFCWKLMMYQNGRFERYRKVGRGGYYKRKMASSVPLDVPMSCFFFESRYHCVSSPFTSFPFDSTFETCSIHTYVHIY